MENIYWIGPRESDIDGLETMFKGSITIYGSGLNHNIAFCKNNNGRINHNERNEECDIFFKTVLKKIIMEDSSAKFLFYNPSLAHEYGSEILAHSICSNDYELLTQLNNKVRCRTLLQNTINVVPFVTLQGKDCTYNIIKTYFNNADSFVIQEAFSSGGEGTVHLTSSYQFRSFIPEHQYLVSPYFDNNLSINAHIIVSDSAILFFPPSVQLVNEIDNLLLYFGADFICYKSVETLVQSKLKEMSVKIGEILQQKGYRGIAGLDFLLKDTELYFVEINPRFQASSQLVNKGLLEKFHTSLQQIHIEAFSNTIDNNDIAFEVPFSNYTYTTNNVHPDRIGKIITSPEILTVQKDGFMNEKDMPSGKNIYLFRCVFGTNISGISHGKMVLYPNIYTEDINSYIQPDYQINRPNIKIALLNHGVTISDEDIRYLEKKGKIREAVFDAIDICLFDTLYVNAPINCKLSTFSPFTITVQNQRAVLLFNGQFISHIEISFLPEELVNRKTSSGVPYESIINLANDRIRINPAPVCIYKQLNIACQFCNLPFKNTTYTIDDIKEIIDYCLNNVAFRHFLIGGGTYSIQDKWEIIIEIAKYIRSKSEKPIYLMSIPPQNLEILSELYKAGITEVAFNLEIFDRSYAQDIMPGKGKIPKEHYFSVFNKSIEIWGDTGNVRSLLIYGFDLFDSFLNGVETLCQNGVEPIISVFRPLNGTPLENAVPPSTIELFALYQCCQQIVEKYSLILGPDCKECQNNTLSYTES